MKRELLAAALFAVATIGVARADQTNAPAEAAKPAPPAPKIQFDKTVYDFGSTSFVDSVTGTFTFSNTGAGDLKMGKPQPSCGCTVASVKPDVLKPGEKGELVFKVNVGPAHGALEKHITVTSNDPQTPSISLAIKVDVKQVIEVSPGQVSVGAIRQGMITNVVVTVHRVDGKKLAISSTTPSSKLVRARVEPIEGSNDESAKLIVEVEGEGVPRSFNENVKVFLDGISQPATTVSVVGRLIGDIAVAPEQLYWPVSDPAHAPVANPEAQTIRRISVTSTRTDQPLEIKNLASSLKDVSLELVAVEAGKSYSIVAKLAEPPKESETGTITFDTNATAQPKVTIPVKITVLKQ